MIKNPLILNTVISYSNALYEFCVQNNCIHIITNDFQQLKIYFKKYYTILKFFKNPILDVELKKQLLKITLNLTWFRKTFNFLNFLVDCNRINLISEIIQEYLNLVYKLLNFKTIEVYTAFDFTNNQIKKLINFLKKMTKTNEIKLFIVFDSTLIGGFLIKIDSIIYDYTAQKQLNLLSTCFNHLNI
jgi:F-type H+-transporting ATPase subunit delta